MLNVVSHGHHSSIFPLTVKIQKINWIPNQSTDGFHYRALVLWYLFLHYILYLLQQLLSITSYK